MDISSRPPEGYTESVSELEGRGLILLCAICGLLCSMLESLYVPMTGTDTGSE